MTTFAETFAERMTRFDENRTQWIAQKGSDAGYNEWFTTQTVGVA